MTSLTHASKIADLLEHHAWEDLVADASRSRGAGQTKRGAPRYITQGSLRETTKVIENSVNLGLLGEHYRERETYIKAAKVAARGGLVDESS